MNQLRYVLLAVTLIALVGVSALALDVPNTFVSGDVISAADMNANFAAVEAAVTALETQVAEAQAAQPLVAHGRAATSNVAVTSTVEAEDIVTVTLDAPAAGVVLVQVTAQVGLFGTDDGNYLAFGIDTEEGGALDGNGDHDFIAGFDDAPGTGTIWLPVAIQRAYEVTSGAQTYRLEAIDLSAAGSGSKYFGNPTITATWYPADRAVVQVPIMTLSTPGGGNLR